MIKTYKLIIAITLTSVFPACNGGAGSGSSTGALTQSAASSAAVTQNTGKVTVSWGLVTGATSFALRSSTDGVHFSSVATLAPSVTTYTATSLVAGSNYTFQIVAINSGGESAPSNLVVTAH